MKLIALIGLLSLTSGASASDFKEKLMNAAKDKKNQEQAKEIAQKGIEYLKSDKKEEPKAEVVSAPAPVTEKDIKPAKSTKTTKKKAKKIAKKIAKKKKS